MYNDYGYNDLGGYGDDSSMTYVYIVAIVILLGVIALSVGWYMSNKKESKRDNVPKEEHTREDNSIPETTDIDTEQKTEHSPVIDSGEESEDSAVIDSEEESDEDEDNLLLGDILKNRYSNKCLYGDGDNVSFAMCGKEDERGILWRREASKDYPGWHLLRNPDTGYCMKVTPAKGAELSECDEYDQMMLWKRQESPDHAWIKLRNNYTDNCLQGDGYTLWLNDCEKDAIGQLWL